MSARDAVLKLRHRPEVQPVVGRVDHLRAVRRDRDALAGQVQLLALRKRERESSDGERRSGRSEAPPSAAGDCRPDDEDCRRDRASPQRLRLSIAAASAVAAGPRLACSSITNSAAAMSAMRCLRSFSRHRFTACESMAARLPAARSSPVRRAAPPRACRTRPRPRTPACP